VVLVLDRSGSMRGWKMVAARRAAARIVDTLSSGDRFAVLTFDDRIDRPAGLPDGLVEASDRNRYRAVEHLARVDARGGTAMVAPLRQALALLGGSRNGDTRDARDAIVILVTDGQVGNEDQLLRELSSDLQRVRVHTVGIDQAVNAGFLGRLASVGGGHCELVESEDRLDESMEAIHRRVGAPLAYSLALRADGLATIEAAASPARLPDLFPGVPLVVTGRYRGSATGSLALHGTTHEGGDWSLTVDGQRRVAPAVTAQWARAHLRDLEDRYASAATEDLAKRIIDTSLRFGVLCRFTAYVAVDSRVIAEGGPQHRVMQPVEAPAGWDSSRAGDNADILFVAAPPPLGAVGTRRASLAAPMASAPADPAGAMPSQPAPSTKAPTGESKARTIKLRNVIVVALVSAMLIGTGWVWSLSRDGLPSPTRDGIVSGKTTESSDAGQISGTRAGVPENTVAAPEAPPPPQAPPDSTYKRDIVTTGSLQMVVAQPTQVADRLVSAVNDAGGRVDARSERSGSSSPTVDLVLRIPADKLDGVLADAKKLGAIDSMSIGRADVTSQRVDLDARIEALQTSVNRLLQLMGRAGNVADLLAAESSLTQRQAELDSLRAQRAALGDQVAYATINVHLSSEPPVTHVGFLGALERGWQSLLSAVHGAVMAVGFLIPWIPVLAVLAVGIVFVLRRKPFRRASSADATSATDS
jgi:hypothetical protein